MAYYFSIQDGLLGSTDAFKLSLSSAEMMQSSTSAQILTSIQYLPPISSTNNINIEAISFRPIILDTNTSSIYNITVNKTKNPLVFVDSSLNANSAVVRNVLQTSMSPFSVYGWSGLLGSDTSSAVIAPSSVGNTSSQNFTLEMWVYPLAFTGTHTIFSKNETSKLGGMNLRTNSLGQIMFGRDSGSKAITESTSTVIATNIWSHIAIVRSGSGANQTALYVNGISVATGISVDFTDNTANCYIGLDATSTANRFNGFISNVRLIQNQALYSGAFTPPTSHFQLNQVGSTGAGAATDITGTTTLLTLQTAGTGAVDASSLSNILTATSSVSLSSFAPFNYDSSINPELYGGSGYFAANSFSVNPGNAFAYGLDNFTIECWVYRFQSASTTLIFAQTVSGTNYLLIGFNATGAPFITYGTGAGTSITGNLLAATGRWSHIAVVRSGTGATDTKIYLNGKLAASGQINFNFNNTTYRPTIGGYTHGGSEFTGYISDLRVIKNQAIYTGEFSPPTSLLTTSTNGGATGNVVDPDPSKVSLLFNFNNMGSVSDILSANYAANTFYPQGTSVAGDGAIAWQTIKLPSVYSVKTNEIANIILKTTESNSISLMGLGLAHDVARVCSITGVNIQPAPSSVTFTDLTPMYFTGQGVSTDTVPQNYRVSVLSASNIPYVIGTDDFTLETWFWPISTATNNTLVEMGAYTNANGVAFFTRSANTNSPYVISNNIALSATNTGTLNVSAWNHIVYQRKSGSLRIFVNGVRSNHIAFSNNLSINTSLFIGAPGATNFSNLLNGYISEIRLIKGRVLYNTNFTPNSAIPLSIESDSLFHIRYGTNCDKAVVISENLPGNTFTHAVITGPLITSGYVPVSITAANLTLSSVFINSNGTLTYPTNTNITLTLTDSVGNSFISNGGTFNIGTSSSPIPANISHTLNLGQDIHIGSGGSFNIYGSEKRSEAYLANYTLPGSNTFTTTELLSSSWRPGDSLYLLNNKDSNTSLEYLTLSGFVDGYTFKTTTNSSFAHEGINTNPYVPSVVNLTRNIILSSFNSIPSYIRSTIDSNINISNTTIYPTVHEEFDTYGSVNIVNNAFIAPASIKQAFAIPSLYDPVISSSSYALKGRAKANRASRSTVDPFFFKPSPIKRPYAGADQFGTIEFWIYLREYPAANTSLYPAFMQISDATHIGFNTAGNIVVAWYQGGEGGERTSTGSGVVPLNTWTHIALQIDNIYINGNRQSIPWQASACPGNLQCLPSTSQEFYIRYPSNSNDQNTFTNNTLISDLKYTNTPVYTTSNFTPTPRGETNVNSSGSGARVTDPKTVTFLGLKNINPLQKTSNEVNLAQAAGYSIVENDLLYTGNLNLLKQNINHKNNIYINRYINLKEDYKYINNFNINYVTIENNKFLSTGSTVAVTVRDLSANNPIIMKNNTVAGCTAAVGVSVGNLSGAALNGAVGALSYGTTRGLSANPLGSFTGGGVFCTQDGVYINALNTNLSSTFFVNLTSCQNKTNGITVVNNSLSSYTPPALLSAHNVLIEGNINGIEAYNIYGTISSANISNNNTGIKIIAGDGPILIDSLTSHNTTTTLLTAICSANFANVASAPYNPALNDGLFFDGTNDDIRITNAYSHQIASVLNVSNSNWTIEGWVQLSRMPSDNITLANMQCILSTTSGFACLIGSTQMAVSYGGTVINSGNNPLHGMVANNWYFLTYSRQGSWLYFYVNGILRGISAVSSTAASSASVFIGSYTGTQSWLAGFISNLRITSNNARYFKTQTLPITSLDNISGTVFLMTPNIGMLDLNKTFYDSSVNNLKIESLYHPLTGNSVIQGYFGPFPGSGSAYFNGTSYLRTTLKQELSTNDFTAEMWVYPYTASTGNTTLFSLGTRQDTVSSEEIKLFSSSVSGSNVGRFGMSYPVGRDSLTVNQITGISALPLNKWTHLALVRSVSTLSLFQDGTRVAYATGLSFSLSGNIPITLGGSLSAADNLLKDYHISNFRFIPNSAVYINTFVPPTSEFNNTEGNPALLLKFTNNSMPIVGDFCIGTSNTVDIDTSVSKYSNASFVINHLTYNQEAEAKIFTSPASSCAFGSGDFTLESWIYLYEYATSNSAGLIDLRSGDGLQASPLLMVSSTKLQYSSSGLTLPSMNAVPLNTWNHIACTRRNGRVMLFINGSFEGIGTDTTSLTCRYITIGDFNREATVRYPLRGHVGDVRFVKNSAVYDMAHTAPTTALSIDGNGILLYTSPYSTIQSSNSTINIAISGYSYNPIYIQNSYLGSNIAFYYGVPLLLDSTRFSEFAVDNTTLSSISESVALRNTSNTLQGSYIFNNCMFGPAPVMMNSLYQPHNVRTAGFVYMSYNKTPGFHFTYLPTGQRVADVTGLSSPVGDIPSERLIPNTVLGNLKSGSKFVAVDAGNAAIVSVDVRRSSTSYNIPDSSTYNGFNPQLILKANPAIGINKDIVLATLTTPSENFTTLTGTTPYASDDGVLEFYVQCSGTSGFVNVDNWTVTPRT